MNFILKAFAAQQFEKVPEGILNTPQDLVDKIANIGDWIFTILLVLAVIFIVLAAYKYLFSQGGEEVGAAHKMLLYAAVAVAVAFLARGMVEVVRRLVGAPAGGASSSTTTGPGGSTSGPAAVEWASLPFSRSDTNENPFNVRVQKCEDKETPGVVITYGDNSSWGNFPDDGAPPEDGNPRIPKSGNPSGNAGKFISVGSLHTGIQTPFGGLGDGYAFQAEVCNNDAIPVIQIDKSKDGSWQIVN